MLLEKNEHNWINSIGESLLQSPSGDAFLIYWFGNHPWNLLRFSEMGDKIPAIVVFLFLFFFSLSIFTQMLISQIMVMLIMGFLMSIFIYQLDFLCGSDGKEFPCTEGSNSLMILTFCFLDYILESTSGLFKTSTSSTIITLYLVYMKNNQYYFYICKQ